jgi:hypothetical protein
MSFKNKFTYNKISWNVIRRHPDYVEFCKKNEFDENGWLIITDVNAENANNLMQRFGIMMILSCEINANESQLTSLFYTASRAVTRVTGHFDSLPETHIRVDIDTRAPFTEIAKDIKHWLRLRKITRKTTRENFKGQASNRPYPFKKFDPKSDLVAFEVWDLVQQGKKTAQIAKILWPDEYSKAIKQEKKYQELIKKYKNVNGLEDFESRAYEDVYKDDNSYNSLLKRVDDKKKRMEKLFELFKR